MIYGSQRLLNVHPDLVRLVHDVGTDQNVQVVQGARSVADEQLAIDSGHSKLTDPLDSKHVIDPVRRPLALAVDIAPWPVDWNDLPSFEALGATVKGRATVLQIPIIWGGDYIHWKDYDHVELVQLHG